MREETLKVRMSPDELALFGALSVGPYSWVQQRAVDVYNIDISMDKPPVAVEVEVGSAFAVGRVSFANERIKHLTNEGYLVIYVITGRRRMDPATVSKKINSFVEVASTNKTLFGQYGVIDGEGNILTSSRYDADSVPRILSL